MTQARAAATNSDASPATTLPASAGHASAVTHVRVSIVVPTYRRDELPRRCLRSLNSQDFPRGDLEIIVGDDARSESVPEAVAGAARETGIRHSPLTTRAARNQLPPVALALPAGVTPASTAAICSFSTRARSFTRLSTADRWMSLS